MIIHGNTCVGLASHGSQISSFQVDGKDVIMPRQGVYSPKGGYSIRGGVPIALPWFGTWQQGLPRHGFFRDTLISISEETSKTRVQMIHVFSFPLYPEFSYPFRVSVSTIVDHGKVTQQVRVKNTGTTYMPLNPGFHPYIAMPEGRATVALGCKDFEIGGEKPDIGWEKSLVVPLTTPDAARIHVPGLGTALLTFPSNFTQVVIWAPNDQAVCVEPVLGSEKDFATGYGHWIAPKYEEMFDFSLQLL